MLLYTPYYDTRVVCNSSSMRSNILLENQIIPHTVDKYNNTISPPSEVELLASCRYELLYLLCHDQ